MLGGCDAWSVASGSNLNVLATTQMVTNITFLAYDASRKAASMISCDDPVAAKMIASSLTAGSNNSTSTSCTYAGIVHRWVTKSCMKMRVALCVDCIDPCGSSQCSTAQAVLTLNPCGSLTGSAYGCNGQNNSVTAYRILTVTLVPLSAPPTFKSIMTSTTRTSALISLRLQSASGGSADGTVYCATYSAGQAPSSTYSIIVQGNSASSSHGSVTVAISGLSPATQFDVYCVTQSNLGTSMALSVALQSKQSVRTLCCKNVYVSLSIQSIYQGSSSFNAVQVSFDSSPNNSTTVTIATATNMSTQQLVPAYTVVTSAMRTTSFRYSITSASTSVVGVASLAVSLSGPSASEYAVVYSGQSSFMVLPNGAVPPTPTVSSVSFSNSGLLINVFFSAPTDKAMSTAIFFPCSTLLVFAGSAASSCSWNTPSNIVVILGGAASILVGDSFYILGGKVKAICDSSIRDTCPYLAATSTSVGAAAAPVNPTVIATAPSIIGKCDTFTLDLAGSLGSGGRVWSKVYSVVTTSSGNGTKAQYYLNNAYVVSPPTPVPSGYFPTGLVSITTTLCNFYGGCGSGVVSFVATAR